MKRIIILLIAISCFCSSQAENNWEDVTQNFDKSIAFIRIRVKNTKSTSGSYCCVFFSTKPNDNTTADTKYNINFYTLTIGDGVNQGSGINIKNCTSVGNNWYEYEFKQPIYFSHYQSNTPQNQLKAYIDTFSKVADIVDLGLSVKWASWNLGATSIGDYGGLYGAGDPTGNKTSTSYADYYWKNGESICGTEYDLAYVKWGKEWRMPKWSELEELMTKCQWKNGEVSGVKGNWVIGPNGNSIFLPWAGNRKGASVFSGKGSYGHYWSGDMGVSLHSHGYKDIDINSDGVVQTDGAESYWGQSIRPVYVNTNISSKKTIYVTTAGTLSSYISDSEKNVIEELTISGKLNGTDFRFLREMAGRNHLCIATNGRLKVLDLSNAQIVKGGEKYVDVDNIRLEITTDNIVPRFLFHDCNLTKIVLPTSITRFESEVFENCKYLSSVNIPSNITSIGGECFMECTSLQTITIPNSVTSIGKDAFKGTLWYNNQNNGVVYAGKVAYTYKGTMGNDTNLSLTSGTVGIADHAFENCTGLKFVTFPSSIKHIGANAFKGCASLSSITSNISSPFEINSNVFDSSTYKTANLFVPDGKASIYSRTSGWSSFLNIVDNYNPVFTVNIGEVDYELNKKTKYATVKQIHATGKDIVIPSSVSYNSISYKVNAIGDIIFQNYTDNNLINSVTFPSTITSVSEKAFRNFGALAIIWNSTSTKLPSNSFGSDYKNSNFLLYIKSSNLAPSGISNVVVNGTASEITLIDGSPFHCPQSFKANKISYSHNYSMTTGVGECAGWETIALPFSVQTIKHEYKGDLVTFSNYTFDPNSKYRPFWLYNLSNKGFIKASSIKANIPYLISMPNNNKYTDMYNLSGRITFSSTNVNVESTQDNNLNKVSYNGGVFIPNYTLYSANGAFALNVTNDFTTNSNNQKPGSVFLNNYRTIYPFEARFDMKSNTRSIDIIFADGETTDIEKVMFSTDEDKEFNIISLSGHIIRKISQREFENVWNTLPKGVYIVNGKKFIK